MRRSGRQVVRARLREEQALQLRLEGKRYREIAQVLGIQPDNAGRMVYRALERHHTENHEVAEMVRTLELARLDTLQDSLWARATWGDLRAVDRVLRISDQRAKLLGLYAPIQHEVTGRDGGAIEIDVAAAREQLRSRITSLATRLDQGAVAQLPDGGNGHRTSRPAV